MIQNTIRIVVVDDHPVVIDGLKLSLKDTSNISIVGEAVSETQMYTVINKSNPDILILDLNLMGANSLSFLGRIYSLKPSIKIIIFSSYNNPSLIRAMSQSGVNCYLPKDTSKSEIVKAINKVYRGEKCNFYNTKVNNYKPNQDNSVFIDDFLKSSNLTQRELEVIRLIVNGLTSDEISQELFISKHTVQSHRKNILRKLKLHDRADIVKFAYDNKLM